MQSFAQKRVRLFCNFQLGSRANLRYLKVQARSNPSTAYGIMNTSKSSSSFTGTSRKADLIEAVNDAVEQAKKSSNTSDPLVRWTIEKISGRHGGIAGFKEISVTILAEVT
jgi:hypothetical protein